MEFISKKNITIPKRKKASHKGDNGKVLIIGGSKDYVGALSLAGLAALHSGVDLVTIAAPEKVAWAVNSLSPDLITKKLKGDFLNPKNYNEIKDMIKKSDVILIGNGTGIKKETKQFTKKIIKNNKLKVIDADGIKAISLKEVNNTILTPHKKELEILLNNSFKKDLLKKFYHKTLFYINNTNIKIIQKYIKNNIILLKGAVDIIISKNKIAYNKTGNQGMTKGGTGDVLAGLCAGYLAQTKDLFGSACTAGYINGLIADILLKKKKGFTYLASDMVEEIKRIK